MKELLRWIDSYERRNDYCISVIIHADGSGHVSIFTEEAEPIFGFDDEKELKEQLLNRIDT